MMNAERGKALRTRFSEMFSARADWEPAWRDIKAMIVPRRGRFSDHVDGKKIDHKTLLNQHGTRSLNILAAGMSSGLSSPARPWFKLGPNDPDLASFGPVREWLDQVQSRMLMVLAHSNFYGALNLMYAELGSFGTAAMVLLEDFKTVIRAETFTSGEYALALGADSRVNAFARKYQRTVGQLVEAFGKDNCPKTVQTAYDAHNLTTKIPCCHLLEPNDSRVSGAADFRGKEFRSAYWVDGETDEKFLRLSGFEESPLCAGRWDVTTTSDVYGQGPGWDALGDIRMLQRLEEQKLKGVEKTIDPPVQADADTEVNLTPGGVSRYKLGLANAGVRSAYDVRLDIGAVQNTIEITRAAISSAFFADLFLLLANAPNAGRMTAREVVERHEEKLLVLGPVLERVHSEILNPSIDRTFAVMLRTGLIPPPPEELQGTQLRVEYISILAQAQKMIGTQSIERTLGFVGQVSGAVPDALDVVDVDASVREYADLTGAPARIIRSPEDVARIRRDRAEAQRKAKAEQDAGAMVQGAKLLSETRMNQGSALDALVGVS